MNPTATQAENDLAARGKTVLNKTPDGSPLDPNTPPWAQTVPINNTLPIITGANPPTVGSVLHCSNGAWTFAASYSYQWYRGGNAIPGATAADHTVITGDKSHALLCGVTATNLKGSTTAGSAATTPVP